ncbi:MAG: aldehyde dehydrogenase family protein [Deltaproteobacteria bacterium]|jgi:sulfoacetaldehyde dehydrogenase|nr:aldehyde dehydrogenase family protein [Deltaproteobacteria bacterium]
MENNSLIDDLVSKARAAQEKVANYTQAQIDDVCKAVAWQVYKDENIRQLARLAVDETGMGNYEDKLTKHKNKVLGIIVDALAAKTVGLIERDEARGISKYAKPVGVVGALTPTTNPTATPSSNGVAILKGRNAVIFAPHPRSKKATALAVSMMRNGLKIVGAPEDLVQVIAEPSIDSTNELMKKVDLILATGGAPMVKAAYSSGKPAFGVGPGNSCQIIAEDADVSDAAEKIKIGKTFDYATSCSSENSIVIHKSIYEKMIHALQERGGHLCSAEERARLKDLMWKPNKHGAMIINIDIVAKSAVAIAAGANINVPENTKMLLVEGDMPLEDDLFAEEKISPVLTIYKYDTFGEGVEILTRLTDNCGKGHSCGIHTFNREYIEYLGQHMRTSRIVVRQPQAAANGGTFYNGMPSTVTLGCGTWGNNITTENISIKHFINVTWLSEPIPLNRPTDDAVWGEYFAKYGK